MTPAGIEPATFRFVAQHLNHCATAVPQSLLLRTRKRNRLMQVIQRRMILMQRYFRTTGGVQYNGPLNAVLLRCLYCEQGHNDVCCSCRRKILILHSFEDKDVIRLLQKFQGPAYILRSRLICISECVNYDSSTSGIFLKVFYVVAV